MLKILLLVAVALMPFAMGGAMASTQRMTSHVAMSHCQGAQPAKHRHSVPSGECTMACASALPASPATFASSLVKAKRVHQRPAIMQGLGNIVTEIATPPPRAA